MQEYIQVIIDVFPDTRLPKQQVTYAATREFKDSFDRNSTEYQEMLNFYIVHAGKSVSHLVQKNKQKLIGQRSYSPTPPLPPCSGLLHQTRPRDVRRGHVH